MARGPSWGRQSCHLGCQRHCACFGKLVYSLRLVPPTHHSTALKNFDNAVRACFESFSCFFPSQDEWDLATLSTSRSGLGLRSTERHSTAAFIASRSSCHELCCKIDPDHQWELPDAESDIAIAVQAYNSSVLPEDRLPHDFAEPPKQRNLSTALDNHTLHSMKDKFQHSDVNRLAHIQLTSAESAGRWLHALPTANNKVDGLLYKTMLQRWLRSPVLPTDEEFTCQFCGEVMDHFGDHPLSCSCGADRTKRHNHIRNETFFQSSTAALSPELEKPGLLQPRPLQGTLPEDGVKRDNPAARRPADVYIPRWRQGAPVALDFAVTSGLRASALRATLQDAGSATVSYEDFKNNYLDTRSSCIQEGIHFKPMVMEAVGGGWGPTATKVFYDLAKAKATLTGETTNTVLNHIYQNLGIQLHRENARAILRRCAPVSVDTSFLTAAATLSTQDADPDVLS